ncbi:hypothetical protein TRFO_10504 [Tritrichomonas foetus]|uniref:Uncharacterized protein n=1 Tax=Tritrichomonas foetus TaxID=1144522 RepID=A0A1J4JAW7_9EUKA|nr:hypothetical protein TRFO_10504 [Tritrichomonas foetus]|eukprot:OHS95375.1 hypothetical protein TRFO_10504 [Tritrichomonas foetus]
MLFSFFVYLSSTLKYNQNDIIYQEIKKQWPSKQLNSICNHFDIPNSFPSFVLGNIFNTEEESCRMLESIIRKTNGDVSRFFYDPKSPISFRAFLSADKIIEIENSTIPFNNNQDIPRPNNNNNHKNIDFLNLENISDFVQEYSWEHFGNWSLSDVITKSKRRLAFIIGCPEA